MILGIFTVFIGFILLRGFFSSDRPWCYKLGLTARTYFCNFDTILNWGILIVGLFITFYSSIQIGLVVLGCFIVLYNTSLEFNRGRAIPILYNSRVYFSGLVIFITGLVLSFITSLYLGLFALAFSFVARTSVKILIGIEMRKWIEEHKELSAEEIAQEKKDMLTGFAGILVLVFVIILVYLLVKFS